MSHVSITGTSVSGSGPYTVTVTGTNTSHPGTNVKLDGTESGGGGYHGTQIAMGSSWSVDFTGVNAGSYEASAVCLSDTDEDGPVPRPVP